MIYGIVASETPTVVVPTPEAGADFIAGTYDWQGTPITASQFTDKSAWIGAGGLQVPASGASAKIIYAALKTFLASCSWTVVIEAETLNTATVWHPLVVSSSGDGMWVDLQCIPFGTVEWYCNDRDASSERAGLVEGN